MFGPTWDEISPSIPKLQLYNCWSLAMDIKQIHLTFYWAYDY